MKWEYCKIHRKSWESDDEWLTDLNVLGVEEWELVAVTPDTEEYNITAYFKRQTSPKDN